MSVKNKKMLRWAHLPECQSPPQGWIVSSFTKCAEVIAGQSPPSDTYNEKGQGLPFLQGNADFGYKYPMPKAWCTTPQKTAKKNDTLISVRAPVGEVNRADQSYVIGRGLAALRPIGIDTNFLFQAIQRWRFCLQRVAQGTTFDAVTARHFVQLHVAIPSLPEEQEAIARILDAVAMVIEQTRGAVERARVLKKSLVQHLFEKGLRGEAQHKTAIGLIPNSWRVVPVNAVVTQFQYGLSGEMSSKGKYPILRMGNIQAGEILFDDLKYIDLPEKIADT